MTRNRFKLTSATSGDLGFVNEVVLPILEIADDLERSNTAIKQMLNWRLEKKVIVFTPKPEAFGIVRIGGTTIEIYPKFANAPQSIDHSFLTNLFHLSSKVFVGKPQADKTLSGESGLFDFYFFVILSDLKTFLRRYNRLILKTEEEEVIGVRGRLKPMESIRRSGGLKHRNVCEVQTVEPRYEFLGLIKGFAKLMGEFASHPEVKDMAQSVCRLLNDVKALPFDTTRIRHLRTMTRTIVSEHRDARGVIQTMLGIFDLLELGIGDINHSCFSFNMNHHFEVLTTSVLERYSSAKNKTLLSGNDKALDLLANSVSGLSISSEEDSFDAGAIKIKPDCYFVGPKGEVEWVLDAKYKVLTYDLASSTFQGVQSKDVQQLLAYWLHFFNETGKRPNLTLVYPEVANHEGKGCLRTAGRVTLVDPTRKQSEIHIDICMLDIQKALKEVLEPSEGNNLINQIDKLSA